MKVDVALVHYPVVNRIGETIGVRGDKSRFARYRSRRADLRSEHLLGGDSVQGAAGVGRPRSSATGKPGMVPRSTRIGRTPCPLFASVLLLKKQ